MSERLSRTVKYYKKHGMKKTVVKFFDVLLHSSWKFDDVTKEEIAREREIKFEYNPKLSILIPMYKTPINFFNELLDAFQGQTYTNWELCLADGSGEDTEAYEEVLRRQETDSRIKYKRLETNGGISENTNAALEMAIGDYIVLCDHDDLVTFDAFFRVVEALNQNPEIDTLYTDEDKVDFEGGKNFDPNFKSDFNIDYLRCGNYICHMFVTRREIAQKVRFLSEYDGAQDFDFILRCAENSKVIHHVPRIVYHWRCHMNSTALNPQSKMYAYEHGRKAVEDHLIRQGIKAVVSIDQEHLGYLDIKYLRDDMPEVTIITGENIRREVIETIEYDNLKIEYVSEYTPKNINNAIKNIDSEYVMLLDNRIKKVESIVVWDLVTPLARKDLASVFGRVYANDDTIYSAGVVLGMYDIFGKVYAGTDRDNMGNGLKLRKQLDMAASDLSCVMFKTKDIKSIGGLDESMNTLYAGVDMFIRLTEAGKGLHMFDGRIVSDIDANRGWDGDEEIRFAKDQIEIFKKKWPFVEGYADPSFNINFSNNRPDYLPVRKKSLLLNGVIEN